MKKLLKFLLITVCIFISINIIHADENGQAAGSDDTAPANDKVQKQLNAIEAYCTEGSKLNGCIYQKTNSLYAKIPARTYSHTDTAADFGRQQTGVTYMKGILKTPELTLHKGYQTFDGNGNGVFAGCYKYELTESTYNNAIKNSEFPMGKGTYFIFTFVIQDSKKGCQVKKTEIIPAKGTMGYYYDFNLFKAAYQQVYTTTFDGKTSMFGANWLNGSSSISLKDWTAEQNGECPLAFGYTANTAWYTKDSNKYIFSNNTSAFNVPIYSIFHDEAYESVPGCAVKDVTGENTNRQILLNEIKTAINNYKCPSKIEDMNKLSDELASYYSQLKNDNKYRVLWSHDLAQEVIAESEAEINKYIKEKITSCQYGTCNITATEKTNIDKNLGTACKNGCSINNYTKPSSDANAKCYCCGGSQGCTYTWTTTKGANCSLQKDIPMGLCIGTTKDLECRNCLVSAYKKAGLSEEKSKCLMDTEILKNITESNIQDANDQAADNALEEEMQENSNTRKEIFNNLIKEPNLDIYSSSMTCKQLLGDGLTKILDFAINAVRIIGVIGTIVIAMTKLIPAVNKGDQGELQKAGKTCIWSAIVLILIVMLPTLIKVIGKLFGFDTSCIL